jgi:hypothetical protein
VVESGKLRICPKCEVGNLVYTGETKLSEDVKIPPTNSHKCSECGELSELTGFLFFSSKTPKLSQPSDFLSMCVRCYATEEGGSWGAATIKAVDGDYGHSLLGTLTLEHAHGKGHCHNCGASGCTIVIPRWAVDSLRQQASWVGKRYYPIVEDSLAQAELRALRSLVPHDSGRTVEVAAYQNDVPEGQTRFSVEQNIITAKAHFAEDVKDVRQAKSFVQIVAPSKEEAVLKAKLKLPFVDIDKKVPLEPTGWWDYWRLR